MATTNRTPFSPWSSSLLGLPNPAAALLGLFEPANTEPSLEINLHQGKDQLVVSARMPGIEPEQLKVSLEGGLLHISAQAPQEEAGEPRRALFQRSLRPPFRLDPESVEAVLHNGLLTVTAKRNPSDAPRTIAINSPAN